jgi:hypothetical protein
MSHVLAMLYQRFVNISVGMKRLPMEFSYVFIKIMQAEIHKCITWPSGKADFPRTRYKGISPCLGAPPPF